MKEARRGFSLVEVLTATVLLAGTVVTLGGLGSGALLAARGHAAAEQAALLADRQLALIEASGVTPFLEAGPLEGDFQDLAPGYTWQVTAESFDVDALVGVTVTVRWSERHRPRQLSVKTYFDGTTRPLVAGSGEAAR